MGVVRGGDEHEAAIQRILKVAKSAGKETAIFCTFFLVVNTTLIVIV
jgi:4-hydroxy-2-oxoheptanedioate aldolase